MEQVENLPSIEGDAKDVLIIDNDETEDNIELKELKERANKLCEQLKILNTSEDNSEVSSMVEINDDDTTIVETKRDPGPIQTQNNDDSESLNILSMVANISEENIDDSTPRKQRSFVKLLKKTDLGDSLEEVNNILAGIEQELNSKDVANPDNLESKSQNKFEEESSDESSDKTWKPHRPKKTISFCLPEIPPTQAESIDQDSPSDDKALIDDQSISSEATVSENLSNNSEMLTEITTQQKKIDLKAKQIEKNFGHISKQKYFSNLDDKNKENHKEGNNSAKKESLKTGWPTIEQKQVYSYPDYTSSVYRPVKSQGKNFWQMPFRHKMYQEVLNPSAPEASDSEDEVEPPPPPPSQADLDPRMFAPTGDVYSYFQRRKIDPFFYTNPLSYSTRNSLGGKYSKVHVY